MPDPSLAYISQGQLYLQSGGVGKIVESPFGRSLRDRAIEIYNRHAWKTAGRGGQSLSRALRAPAERDPAEFPIDITSVSAGSRPGEIFYTLETNEICGVFARDGDGVERRLFHTADYRLRHPDVHPSGAEIAISIYHGNGAVNLALLSSDGSNLTEITEGESVDVGPRWTPGSKRRLVFQSAGIGRTPQGRRSGHSPFSIQQLDLDTGEMCCLAQDNDFDFLWPRIASDGGLYYIRRPSANAAKKDDAVGALKDAVLWPLRFLMAIGLLIDAFVGLQTGHRIYQPRVADKRVKAPSSWQLMRQSGNATASSETIARGAMAYDFSRDGSLIYTDGFDVFRVRADGGGETKILTGVNIDLIAML